MNSKTNAPNCTRGRFVVAIFATILAGIGIVCLPGNAADGVLGRLIERAMGLIMENPLATQAPTQHFKNMLAYQRGMDASIPDGAVLFLGDSITQSLAVAAVAPHAVNLGIGHQTTQMMLEAIPSYGSLHRASSIVLTIGINDILHGNTAGLHDRLRKIDSAIPAGKRVIWNAIMPIRPPTKDDKALSTIAAANTAIRSLCAARSQCVYVDTWALFAPHAGVTDERALQPDGIHLNDGGYRRWIAALRASI